MKAGRTLQEMAAELMRQNEAKRDYLASGEQMQMDGGAAAFTLKSENADIDLGMTQLFHRQMGGALGIPANYYDRMKAEKPDLLAHNVNEWLTSRPDKRNMIRTLDGTARAFLSDRYRRIDNYDIAMASLPIIGEMKGARVESCEVTDNRMYLKVVNERLTAEVVPGDLVQAGIVISNSEVGLGSVSVMPLIYRLVCSNGMIVNTLGQRKYHIGREHESVFELFRDETIKADDAAFMMKLQDIIRSAVDEARFGQVVDKLRESTEVEITGKIAKVVELTSAEFGFNSAENDNILKHLILGNDLSMYGLSGAITRASQDVEDYERATAMETAGWGIVTMEPQKWTEINEKGAA